MRTIVETSKGYVLIDTCDTADHGLETMVFSCTEDGEVQSWRDLDARRYATVPEAEKCEKTHKIPIKVDKAKYEKGDIKKEYPESVLIHFTDDTSARYYRKGW